MLKVWTAMRKNYIRHWVVLVLRDIKLVNTELMFLLHLGHWTIQPRSLLMELRKAEALSTRGHGDNSNAFQKATMETISWCRTVSFCSNTFNLSLPNSSSFFFSDKLTFMATVTNQKLSMNDILLVRWRTYSFSFHSFIICSCSSIIYYCSFWENVSALT